MWESSTLLVSFSTNEYNFSRQINKLTVFWFIILLYSRSNIFRHLVSYRVKYIARDKHQQRITRCIYRIHWHRKSNTLQNYQQNLYTLYNIKSKWTVAENDCKFFRGVAYTKKISPNDKLFAHQKQKCKYYLIVFIQYLRSINLHEPSNRTVYQWYCLPYNDFFKKKFMVSKLWKHSMDSKLQKKFARNIMEISLAFHC